MRPREMKWLFYPNHSHRCSKQQLSDPKSGAFLLFRISKCNFLWQRGKPTSFYPPPCLAVFISVLTFVFCWPQWWRSFPGFPVPIAEDLPREERSENCCPATVHLQNHFYLDFPNFLRNKENWDVEQKNLFCLSWCLIMYATSLGGLSGLGTFYKRDLLMTKLMWLSEWVWEGYWNLSERKSVRKAECICLILSLMWMDHTLWEEIGLFFLNLSSVLFLKKIFFASFLFLLFKCLFS